MLRDESQDATGGTSEQEAPSLGDAAAVGTRWILLSRIPAEVGGLVTAVVLAHLVDPADYGRAAVANALAMIATILSFEGFGTPLVQRAIYTRREGASSFAMSLAFGLVAALLVLLGSAFVAPGLFGDRTAVFLALTAPIFVIAAAGATSMAILQRRLDFRTLTLAEVGPLLAQCVVSIVVAALGHGGLGIVIGLLVNAVLTLAILVYAAPPPLPRVDRATARETLRFGIPAALAGLTSTLRRNVAYFVIGAGASVAVTGLYWRAFQVGGQYQSKLSGVLLRMMFPLLARTRDAEHMRGVRLRVVRANAVLTVPLLALFVIVAPEVFPFVFGSQWTSATTAAQLLTVVGLALALTSGSESVALAAGRPGTVLRYSLVFLLLYGGVTALTVSHGLTAIALGAVGVHVAMLWLSQWMLVSRTVGLPVLTSALEVAPAIVAGAVQLALGGAVAVLLRGADAPGVVVVAASSVVALLAYVLLLRRCFPDAWGDLAGFARRTITARRSRR